MREKTFFRLNFQIFTLKVNWLQDGRVRVRDLRSGAGVEWDGLVSGLDIAFDSTAEAVRKDIEVFGGLVKVRCLFCAMSYTSCSICNWNNLEIIHISNIQIIVYNWMYSVRSWLELDNLQMMKNRKKDNGLSVRCMILLQHSFQRNEPKDGAREENIWSGYVHVSGCPWVASDGQINLWLWHLDSALLTKYVSAFVPALVKNTFIPPSLWRAPSLALPEVLSVPRKPVSSLSTESATGSFFQRAANCDLNQLELIAAVPHGSRNTACQSLVY